MIHRGLGVLDFVREHTDEREFYDDRYESQAASSNDDLSESDLLARWSDPWFPQDEFVLARMGELRDKRILLIGNGLSVRELWFQTRLPKYLVFSDLSARAVAEMQRRSARLPAADSVIFATFAAFNIPFPANSFDLVYAYAMVHHLDDIPRFLAEVARVLAPGGRSVFMDDARSPLWFAAKRTILRPLMRFSHKRSGISPEDLRFTMSGGFEESALAELIERHGCRPWFERTSFLNYLWHRGCVKLLPDGIRDPLLPAWWGRTLSKLDSVIASSAVGRANMIRLIWGFDKDPAAPLVERAIPGGS